LYFIAVRREDEGGKGNFPEEITFTLKLRVA
jgi:hypothetical protein